MAFKWTCSKMMHVHPSLPNSKHGHVCTCVYILIFTYINTYVSIYRICTMYMYNDYLSLCLALSTFPHIRQHHPESSLQTQVNIGCVKRLSQQSCFKFGAEGGQKQNPKPPSIFPSKGRTLLSQSRQSGDPKPYRDSGPLTWKFLPIPTHPSLYGTRIQRVLAPAGHPQRFR